jgi:hypothetical protein
MDFPSYGRCFCCVQEPVSCAQVHMFAFPPPLVGAELERKLQVFASAFVKQLI